MAQTPVPSTTEITVHRNSEAVLAVNIPGRPPYAVLVRHFKFPRRQSDITGAGLPALVSATDPNDVDVQWDDVPSVASQLADRMSASMSAAQDRMARQQSISAQIMAAMQRVSRAGRPRRCPTRRGDASAPHASNPPVPPYPPPNRPRPPIRPPDRPRTPIREPCIRRRRSGGRCYAGSGLRHSHRRCAR